MVDVSRFFFIKCVIDKTKLECMNIFVSNLQIKNFYIENFYTLNLNLVFTNLQRI